MVARRGDYFAHDGLFWRRMAAMGAQRFPSWWLRYSPPVFGVAAAVALPGARRAVRSNLRRIHGRRPFLREMIDTTQTFTSYAGCLAETLSMGSKNHVAPEVSVTGREAVLEAVKARRGLLILTMHTGGWEAAGQFLAAHTKLDVVLVMEEERVASASAIQDRARTTAEAIRVIRIGADPLSALPLVRHIMDGKGAAAMQVDRVPSSGRAVPVRWFDGEGVLPEGPFRLAQLTGAPLVPVFCRRRGFRSYAFDARVPRTLARRASPGDIARMAQTVADDMMDFLRANPTQWFEWGPRA